MPSTVYSGKDGTIFNINSNDYLGNFKTCTVTVNTTVIEHHGPQDDVEFITAIRRGLQVSSTSFVSIGGSAQLLGDLTPPVSNTGIVLNCNLADGRSLNATGFLIDDAVSISDDPNEESFTFRATGSWGLA